MAATPGGARRYSVQQDPETMTMVLSQYIKSSPTPFTFGTYDGISSNQAASGPGLLGCLGFIRLWVDAFPEANVAAKTFSSSLDGLMVAGSFVKFPPGHSFWQGTNVLDARSRALWIDKAYLKVVTLLNHVRRVCGNEIKKKQAYRSLTPEHQMMLEEVMLKVQLPPKRPSADSIERQPSSTSMSSMPPCSDSQRSRQPSSSSLASRPPSSSSASAQSKKRSAGSGS